MLQALYLLLFYFLLVVELFLFFLDVVLFFHLLNLQPLLHQLLGFDQLGVLGLDDGQATLQVRPIGLVVDPRLLELFFEILHLGREPRLLKLATLTLIHIEVLAGLENQLADGFRKQHFVARVFRSLILRLDLLKLVLDLVQSLE